MRLIRLLSAMCLGLTTAVAAEAARELPSRSESRSLAVKQSADAVFRKIAAGAEACFASDEVRSRYYAYSRTGKISVTAQSEVGEVSRLLVEIAGTTGGSAVDVYYFRSGVPLADAVEQWLQGNPAACPQPP